MDFYFADSVPARATTQTVGNRLLEKPLAQRPRVISLGWMVLAQTTSDIIIQMISHKIFTMQKAIYYRDAGENLSL